MLMATCGTRWSCAKEGTVGGVRAHVTSSGSAPEGGSPPARGGIQILDAEVVDMVEVGDAPVDGRCWEWFRQCSKRREAAVAVLSTVVDIPVVVQRQSWGQRRNMAVKRRLMGFWANFAPFFALRPHGR